MTEIDVIRSKCLNSLEFFTRYFFKELNGKKFTVNDHHKDIFSTLTDIHKGEITRQIMNIAPRYSKTEIGVKMFISWSLAHNPKARFIHLSYSDGLALDNSEAIKDIILSEKYQRLFPYVQIKKDSTAKQKWYTTEGGGVLARAAAGQVTGFGAGTTSFEGEEEEFGGCIIIDDPLKPDDAESDLLRNKVNNRFDTTIKNRVNSRKTPIIIIMQRLHENDLCGYVQEKTPDEWNVLSMPVIKNDGTALWSEKHTIEELNDLRQANEFVFDTQYMQDPTPKKGLLFSELNRFKRSDVNLNDYDAGLAFADVADTGQDNHSVPFAKLQDSHIFIHDVVFTTEGTEQNVPLTVSKANEYKPEFMQIESNFGGSMYIQLMGLQDEKMNGKTALIPMRSVGNKHTRIITMKGFIEKYCYFLDESEYLPDSDYARFMKNLKEYRKIKGATKHDDAPDSMAGLCRMIASYYPHLFEPQFISQIEQSV